ncbi:hypothetical protein PVK06_014309 [Gossypium arboreum]|uniref:Cytochrome P450 94C1-like n=1 Tax=Gossypium arboreum TaxID=29729 RepID=A0ABR0PU76_GOSAR|nr:hypothetical protein PVK06_014309 [Gossypium arboreum]
MRGLYSWFSSMFTAFCFMFFSFILLLSLFSVVIFVLRLKLGCKCEICHAYLTSSWTEEFDNLCDWFTHLLEKSATGTIHIHVLGNTITANPENVEHILKTRFENYPKGKPFAAILGDLLGKGIFNVDGDSWKFQRKMASLELGSISVRRHGFDIVSSEIQSRLLPLLSSVSASRLSAQRGLASSPLIWKFKRLLNLGTEKQLKQAIKMVNELAQKMINQRREKGFSDPIISRFNIRVPNQKQTPRFAPGLTANVRGGLPVLVQEKAIVS